MGPSAVGAAGLVLDIAGALFLALGLMTKKPQRAIDEATTKYDFNLDLDASLASQTADAQVGGFVLILGFLVQMVAALGWHRTSSWDAVAYAIVSAFAFDLLAAGFLFRVWRPRRLRSMLVVRLAKSDMGIWWPVLAAYGQLLGEPSDRVTSNEETIAQYAERLLRWRWGRLTEGLTLPDVYVKFRRDLAGTAEYEEAHPRHTRVP